MSNSNPLLNHTVCYVGESFDEKARNRQIFFTTLQNIQFFSRQGLVFQGNNNEGNFDQLMKLSTKVDPKITSWMEKKQEKCFQHDMHNEIIRLTAFIILRDITKKINNITFYSIMANEVKI